MRVDLLRIDEMGYLNLRPEQSNIFFKLMKERYRKKVTIITTNLNARGCEERARRWGVSRAHGLGKPGPSA